MGDVLEERIEGFIKFLKAGEWPATIFERRDIWSQGWLDGIE